MTRVLAKESLCKLLDKAINVIPDDLITSERSFIFSATISSSQVGVGFDPPGRDSCAGFTIETLGLESIIAFADHTTSSSAVDHPAHYGGASDPYEAIKVIEAWDLGFNLGNAVKYLCRAGKKGSRLEDLEKASWYLAREIKNEQKKVAL